MQHDRTENNEYYNEYMQQKGNNVAVQDMTFSTNALNFKHLDRLIDALGSQRTYWKDIGYDCHEKTIKPDWTPENEALLEQLCAKYSKATNGAVHSNDPVAVRVGGKFGHYESLGEKQVPYPSVHTVEYEQALEHKTNNMIASPYSC